MYAKRLVAAAAIGVSALLPAAAPVGAVPLDPPPPCPNCQPDPAGPEVAPTSTPRLCWPYGRVGPGSPRGGGGQPAYPPQCHPTAPPGPAN